MRLFIAFVLWVLEGPNDTLAQSRHLPILPDSVILHLSQEISGQIAKRNIEFVARHHRMRGSRGFHAAAAFIVEQLRSYGLSDAKIEQFPADGKTFYGPQKARKAWWRENENLVRWGHLDSFANTPGFAFMITLKQARALQARLSAGEKITLKATVRAGRHEGFYEVVTATIPGVDPILKAEEIAFSCHLDHQLPGANDNSSGSTAILEVARTFASLIHQGKLPPPARTLRFIWPPEIEGTHALLSSRPELATRIKAVVHMDMVGGGAETKAIFHVTRGPASLPSIVNDVAETVGEFVNRQSQAFAMGSDIPFPLISPTGGKEALQADFAEFTMGSDHEVYTDASYGIPAIYLNDWPDRYIHTNFDTPANIDPTKLKRATFIGAASAWVLANLKAADAPGLWQVEQVLALRRTAKILQCRNQVDDDEAQNLTRFHHWYERQVFESTSRFFAIPESLRQEAARFFDNLAEVTGKPSPAAPAHNEGGLVFRRTNTFKGPLSTFGYDYFADHYGDEAANGVGLLSYRGPRGSGGEYAYEVLNFVDGRRTVRQIRDNVAAIYGPVPVEMVMEYLRALEKIDVVGKAN
ncbi:MAG: M28 family peptidase [bacterium]